MTEYAEKLVKKGEKHLSEKTFFGKLKPNHEDAVDCFNQAGNAYKAAKMNQQASDCFVKAGECYNELTSIFLAGKAYENAAMLLKDIKESEMKAAELYHKASDCFLISGSNDRACDLLDKAASISTGEDSMRYFQGVLT
jgi:gamma-soluble NSF attachment protein